MFDLTLTNSFIIVSCNGNTRGSAIESHSLYLTIHSHLLLLSLLLVGIHSHTHKYGNTTLLPTYAHIHTTAPCMLPTASQPDSQTYTGALKHTGFEMRAFSGCSTLIGRFKQAPSGKTVTGRNRECVHSEFFWNVGVCSQACRETVGFVYSTKCRRNTKTKRFPTWKLTDVSLGLCKNLIGQSSMFIFYRELFSVKFLPKYKHAFFGCACTWTCMIL